MLKYTTTLSPADIDRIITEAVGRDGMAVIAIHRHADPCTYTVEINRGESPPAAAEGLDFFKKAHSAACFERNNAIAEVKRLNALLKSSRLETVEAEKERDDARDEVENLQGMLGAAKELDRGRLRVINGAALIMAPLQALAEEMGRDIVAAAVTAWFADDLDTVEGIAKKECWETTAETAEEAP